MNEQRSIEDKLVITLLCLTGVAILCYTTYRAYALSFTHDESLTYLRYVRSSAFQTEDANNHFLNSVLMKLSRWLFGISELALRLPNLLGNVLFLVFSARIVMTFRSAMLTVVAFWIITLNPYLLEFFSLARGYGLSMGLLMGSLFYTQVYLSNDQKKPAMIMSLLIGALAVITNYSLLNYYAALCMLFFICEYYYTCNKDIRLFLRGVPAIMIIPLLVLAFAIPRILNLQKVGDFYFDSIGSWEATIPALVTACVFEAGYPHSLQLTIKTMILVFIGLGMVVSVWYLIRGRPDGESRFLIFAVSVVPFCLAASYTQNALMGTNYPVGRTALFYIPFIAVIIVLFLNSISSGSRTTQLSFLIIGLLTLSNTGLTMNISYTQTWRYDMNTKFAMEALAEAGSKEGSLKFNTTIASNWHFKPAIDYYRDKYNMHWLNKARHTGAYDLFADYYYIEVDTKDQENSQWGAAVAAFPETGTMLFDNKRNPKGVLLKETVCDFEKEGEISAYPNTYKKLVSYSGETSNLVRLEPPYSATYVDTFYKAEFSHPIIVSAKMMVYGMESGFAGGMVMTCEHEEEFYFWEMCDVKTNLQEAKEWKPIDLSCTIPPPESEYYILKIFFFNHGTGDVYIDDFHIKIIDPIIE